MEEKPKHNRNAPDQLTITSIEITHTTDGSVSSMSLPNIPSERSNNSDGSLSSKKVIRKMTDVRGCTHTLVRYPLVISKSGKSRTLDRPCKICAVSTKPPSTENENVGKKRKAMDAGQYCFECGKRMACCNRPNRDCFLSHVRSFDQN